MNQSMHGGVKWLLEKQEWMKTADVAEYLGTSPNNIHNMIYRLYLRQKKFYGQWYFKRLDIDNVLSLRGSSWA